MGMTNGGRERFRGELLRVLIWTLIVEYLFAIDFERIFLNTFPYKQSQENLLRQDGNLRPNFSLLLGIHPQPSHVTESRQNCRLTRPYYQRLVNSSTTLRSSLELKKNLQQQQQQQQRGQLLLLQIAVCKFAIDMPPDQGAGTMMTGFVEL